jgi:peptidoglycan/LPS O-acetylase OafA/YrhL
VVLFVLSGFLPLTDETGAPIVDPFSASNLARNLVMIFPLPGRFAMEPDVKVLRIAWALRVEMAFYFGIAVLLLASRIGKKQTLHVAFNLASAVLLPLVVYYVTARPAWNPILIFAPFFCAGGAFFFSLRGSWIDWTIFAAAMALSVRVTAFIRADVGNPFFWPTFLFVVLMLACLFLAIRKTRTHVLDRLLGDFSYPVYVGHWLPLLVYAATRQSYPSYFGGIAETLLIACGLGLPLTYHRLIEPMTARLRLVVRGVAIR